MTCYKNIGYGPTIVRDTNGVLTGDNLTNVVLPATGKSKLTVVPVLAEDNVQIAYYHYELQFESLIYLSNLVLADTELEIQRLKKILATPGSRLSVWPVGLGKLPVINGVGSDLNIPDLTGGPFCDNITIQPVASNNAILISGVIRFDIPHCSPYITRDLVQFTSGIEYEVDEEGNISFIIETMYQSSTPILAAGMEIAKRLGNAISAEAGKIFVGFKRKTKLSFTRDQRIARIRTELREIPSDAAFAPFTKHIDFTDDLESTLAPGQGDFAVGGFYVWLRTMSCTITLPQRVNKIWAWYVFRNLVVHRLKGVKAFSNQPAILDTNAPANQKIDQEAENKKKSWYLLTKFKISNPLFSRSISFDLEYLFTMSLSGILGGNANIFATVRHNIAPKLDVGGEPLVPVEYIVFNPNTTNNKKLSQEWKYWHDTYGKENLNGIYDFIDSGPITYTQCAVTLNEPYPGNLTVSARKDEFNEQEPTPTTTPTKAKENSTTSITDKDTYLAELTGLYKEASKSWLSYSNKFQIIQKNNNEQVDYIQTVPASIYQAVESASPLASTAGFQINNEKSGDSDGLKTPATIEFGTSTNTIRMRGHAIRVGYKIPCPTIISVGGLAVSRIGESRYEHQTIARSSVLGPELVGTQDETTELPVYLAMWDVTYAINKNLRYEDILGAINSSGNTGVYV